MTCCLNAVLCPDVHRKLRWSSGVASSSDSMRRALHHLLQALLWVCSAVFPLPPFPILIPEQGTIWSAPQLQS